jgi:arabinofuranan 3-O-arabinosyltransferase
VTQELERSSQEGADFIWRVRLLAVVVLLGGLCFRQAPGLVVPDTKLDLTANPAGFLARALHVWDPQGALGQLQNQAYGYLFPAGPFHLVLLQAGLPAWVVQRLWWTTILAVALLGFWRLSGAMRLGTPWLRLVGAVLFALSPRMMSEVAVTSVEVWPLAVAPWVLAPLVDRSPRSWTWRISRSVAAVFCLGGVNAVASGAALVLPGLWFVTRARTRQVLLPAAAWLVSVVAACFWWLAPLVLLGRYSPPFLDWIEDSRVTTGLASVVNASQGTSAWLNFLSGPGGPIWPAGWLLVTTPPLIVASAVVCAAGLAGLARRDMPERTFLLAAALLGVVLLTAGYAGAAHSPFADQVRSLLDGPLAPLRNTHKFELVLRLPLVLGLVHALGVLARTAGRLPLRTLPRWLAPVLGVALVVTATAPAVAAELPRGGAYVEVPGYWHEAARWLDRQPDDGSVLVEPAASFADLLWGSPKDEPLQALARRAFVVRDAVPLGSAGATRVLDEVERRLGEARGDARLVSLLSSLGVRYVLVRNDLTVAAQGSPPLAVHQALERASLTRVAAFGPTVQSAVDTPDLTLNERTLLPFPSLEVYQVPTQGPRFVPADDLYTATAGPENLGELTSVAGAGSAGLLGTDAAAAPGLVAPERQIVTDGTRRRETYFGSPTDNTSGTLTAQDPGRLHRKALGYDSDPGAPRSLLTWSGIGGVTASSSASDAGATIRLGPGSSPAAAVDGDPTTRWVSGRYLSAVGEWLEIDFGRPRSLEGLRVRFSTASPVTSRPSQVEVETDRGRSTAVVTGDGRPEVVIAPPGLTGRLRLRLVAVEGGGRPNGFSIAEVELPGMTATPVIGVPSDPAERDPAAVVVRDEQPGRSGCLHQGERPLCSQRFQVADEEPTVLSRTVDLGATRTYSVSARARARDGSALEKLLEVPDSIRATASSRDVSAPEGRPDAVVDRDLGTGWVASPTDRSPTLVLTLPRTRRVSGLQLLSDPYLAASRPKVVDVRLDSGPNRRLVVDPEGRVDLPSARTRVVTLTFVEEMPLVDVDAVSGFRTQRPVGVSEVRVLGADDQRRAVTRDRLVSLPCGFAPTIRVDDHDVLTSLTTTVGAVVDRAPLELTPCGLDGGRVELGQGRHGVEVRATAQLTALEVQLVDRSVFAGRPAASVPVGLHRPDAAHVTMTVPARSTKGLVTLPQNFNAGWTASDQAGRPLTAVRVDGWQQGWVLPAGGPTTVHAVFEADTAYRLALATGLLALAVLALLLLVTMRTAHRGSRRVLPVGPARLGAGAATALTVVALVLVAGWFGVAATAAGVVVAATASRMRAPWLRPVVAAVAVAGSGALVAARPWTSGAAATDSATAQLLVLCALAVAVVASWPASAEVTRSTSTSSSEEPRRTS